MIRKSNRLWQELTDSRRMRRSPSRIVKVLHRLDLLEKKVDFLTDSLRGK